MKRPLFGWRARVVRDAESRGYVNRRYFRVQVLDAPWWRFWGGSQWRSLPALYDSETEACQVASQVAEYGPYRENLKPAVDS